MPRAVPNVFTVAPGLDFCTVTVEALLAGQIIPLSFRDQPELLASLTIYVPTRRVKPVFEAAFARALAPRPAILPRIRPLAEPGDPLDQLPGEISDYTGAHAMPERRVISPVERRFMLYPLVAGWRRQLRLAAGDAIGDAHASVRETLVLADALGRLIEEMRISGLDLESLADIAPPGYDPVQFDAYWAASRRFLDIAARQWPAMLREINATEEMAARIETIEAEARRLMTGNTASPVMIAGSTGSVPATARLMRAVSRLDNGAVILPGIDLDLDARGWGAIAAEGASIATNFAHAQSSLKRTLVEIGIARDAVVSLGRANLAARARLRLLSETLRPAETIDGWRSTAADLAFADALSGMTLVAADDEHQEALAIAVSMREALEEPETRVALVTADRALARRVRHALARWSIQVTDSAGTSLADAPPARLIRLFLAAAGQRDGVSLMSLLRHPQLRLGFDAKTVHALADALEILVLRGRHFQRSASLATRVRIALARDERREHPVSARIPAATRAALHELAATFDALSARFSPEAPPRALGSLAEEAASTLDALTRDAEGAPSLADAPQMDLLLDLLSEITRHAAGLELAPAAFGGALDLFLAERVEIPKTDHPRAMILGPLEARLASADLLILGGLNEGSFPPRAETDPFLNRAMRIALGLQPPERRIGQSAHDFMMLAGHPRVILSRATRTGNETAIPSRFLRRLEAFIGHKRWKELAARGARAIALAKMLDAPGDYAPIDRPMPVPVSPRVPKRLSITEIETLHRDPYAIYAKHLLRLEPLEAIDAPIDARDRGTILHRALDLYARGEPPADPIEAQQRLRDIGADCFRAIEGEPDLFRFWWQHFEAIIPAFVAFDRTRREAGNRILTETRGETAITLDDGTAIHLSGRADRLEIDPLGRLSVFDYKTGSVPANLSILSGLSPQLPITAAMALGGAFTGTGQLAGIASLAHVRIGRGGAIEEKPVNPGKLTLELLAGESWTKLTDVLESHQRGTLAYSSHVAMPSERRERPYDHLARVREWKSVMVESEGDEE